MLFYKEENGFPINLMIETYDYEEVMEDEEIWKGYESIVFDEYNNVISKFIHGVLNERINWVNGFFEGMKYTGYTNKTNYNIHSLEDKPK